MFYIWDVLKLGRFGLGHFVGELRKKSTLPNISGIQEVILCVWWFSVQTTFHFSFCTFVVICRVGTIKFIIVRKCCYFKLFSFSSLKHDNFWGRVVVKKRNKIATNLTFGHLKKIICQDVPGYNHRWACLVKQQLLVTIYRLPTMDDQLPFYVSVFSKETEVCRFRFLFAAKQKLWFAVFSINTYVYTAVSNGKRKTEAQAIFINSFTVCSSCKRKFAVCLLDDEERNESYPFANGLKGLNRFGLSHLWIQRLRILSPPLPVTRGWHRKR